MSQFSDQMVENVLFEELTHGDAVIDSAGPILRHLLENDDHTLFSDEIVARVRGMVGDVARQLLVAQGEAAGAFDAHAHAEEYAGDLTEALIANAALLAHAHGLALEYQLAERLQVRNSIDPVLSPLLQALIASTDSATASAGMNLLAAQARFCQQQRRMELPLGELPGDLFHAALLTLRAHLGGEAEDSAAAAERKLREGFDESRSRLGLMTRLIVAMGGGALAALSVSHAGVPLFLTALALASGQDRSMAVLATNERQMARLALSLRASGLKPKAVEEQFAYFHPDAALPEGFEHLRADRAATILASSPAALGG